MILLEHPRHLLAYLQMQPICPSDLLNNLQQWKDSLGSLPPQCRPMWSQIQFLWAQRALRGLLHSRVDHRGLCSCHPASFSHMPCNKSKARAMIDPGPSPPLLHKHSCCKQDISVHRIETGSLVSLSWFRMQCSQTFPQKPLIDP